MTNEADKPGVRGFFKRLRAKLNQGPAWLTTDITELLPGRKIDAEILDELETRLITVRLNVEHYFMRQSTVCGDEGML